MIVSHCGVRDNIQPRSSPCFSERRVGDFRRGVVKGADQT